MQFSLLHNKNPEIQLDTKKLKCTPEIFQPCPLRSEKSCLLHFCSLTCQEGSSNCPQELGVQNPFLCILQFGTGATLGEDAHSLCCQRCSEVLTQPCQPQPWLYPASFHWLTLGKQLKNISSLADGGGCGGEASSCPVTHKCSLLIWDISSVLPCKILLVGTREKCMMAFGNYFCHLCF